jgi:hypothetical protein
MNNARRVWFSLLAPAAAFTVVELVGWTVGSRACTSMSLASVRIVTGLVALAGLIVACAGLATGVGTYRRAASTDVAGDRGVFLAMGSVFTSASFAVGLIWFALNALFINVCGQMR